MKRFKEWANRNSWWLPWVGVAASISGLIFPDAFIKTGQTLTELLRTLLQYWVHVLIVVWVVWVFYLHFEIQRLKKRKNTRKKQTKNKVC
ncbi:hypothetical protein D4T97_005650 [Siminovitchia acidinfaciens]|uniref:Uncharacterized protein n=1 Tax=Siminovitchia acidinfaciens TaxID=2321395 RepID=A0A429Y4D1_9BACI|nr:hypothetical protein [Siminovitchia acidinfaciens]RST76260.1 hypothetical protein D4T97_005650 [Siminovitchia acidinfaciens]